MTLLRLSYVALLALSVISGFVLIPVSVNLILSSFLIIYIGSHRSLNGDSENPPLSQKEAWLFPVMGSCVLFSLYLAFKFLGKEFVNLLLGLYFAVIGLVLLQQTLSPVVGLVLSSKTKVINVDKKMPCQAFSKRFLCERFTVSATIADIVAAIAAAAVSVFHYRTRHFLSNNLLGTAFAVQGVEHVVLGTYLNGSIMLVGLFAYDVFWVFGTDVMVTVARSFDAPIKLLFLRAHATEDTDAQFSMLGLGDIVIPGIFIALLLRFDRSQASARLGLPIEWTKTDFPKTYFNLCMVGYVLGLGATLFVMYTFQAAQPALLYLSPACILFSIIPSLLRGEVKALFAFKDEGDEDEASDDKQGDKKKNDDAGEDKAPTQPEDTEVEPTDATNGTVRQRKGAKTKGAKANGVKTGANN